MLEGGQLCISETIQRTQERAANRDYGSTNESVLQTSPFLFMPLFPVHQPHSPNSDPLMSSGGVRRFGRLELLQVLDRLRGGGAVLRVEGQHRTEEVCKAPRIALGPVVVSLKALLDALRR